MRNALILIQAALLSTVVVLGAQGETDHQHACPLPSVQAHAPCEK